MSIIAKLSVRQNVRNDDLMTWLVEAKAGAIGDHLIVPRFAFVVF